MKGRTIAWTVVGGVLALSIASTVGLGVFVLGGGLDSSRVGQRAFDRAYADARPGGQPMVKIGQPVPAFELPGLQDGAPRRLPAPGRPMLINYWASWCGPCREEMPLLSDFARKQGANGVEVVGIALDYPGDAKAFLAKYPTGFPHLAEDPDASDSSARVGNLRGMLPFTVLVDAEGRLQHRKIGSFDSQAELEQWLEAAGVTAAAQQTAPN